MNRPIHLLQFERAPVVDIPLATDLPSGAILRVHASAFCDYQRTGYFGRSEVIVAGETIVAMSIDDARGWERDRMHLVIAALDADGLPTDDGADAELVIGEANFRVSASTARRLVIGGTPRLPYCVAAASTPFPDAGGNGDHA